MQIGWQIHATHKPDCGLGETPQIVKTWKSKSMMAISVKKTRCIDSFEISYLYCSEQGKGPPAGLRCCRPTDSLKDAFHMTFLISILIKFETRYKMVLILTFGPILLVRASAGKLHADDHSKAQVRYMTGLKL